ncbi:MAG: OmpA family protein, partial [Thiomicrorhabdus sp.]|nr:OmpA family protein [Thiomicrorhabdus sp.]
MSIKRQKHSKSIALPMVTLTSLLVLSACTTTSEKENTEAAQNAQPPVVVQVEPTKTATMTTILHQLQIQIQTASTSTQSTLIHLDDQPIIEVTLKDGSFRFGSAKLNPKKREGLTPVLNILNQYPNTTVHIEGHTDSIGSKALNQSLSQ